MPPMVHYIGKNATIMEGALIRGLLHFCEEATISMGARSGKISTKIGPKGKVGERLSNVVFMGIAINPMMATW